VGDKIAAKVGSLGEAHALYAYAAKLREQTALTRAKEKAYNDASAVASALEGELEMLKLDLIKAYNDNILEATKRFGEAYANRFFPTIRFYTKEKETPVQPIAAVVA
jgi:hypothetical protein